MNVFSWTLNFYILDRTNNISFSHFPHDCIDSNMFNIINTSCPYDNWVTTARESCADPDRYHCLTDEYSRPGWICTDPIWVEADRCPEFNLAANKMDSAECSGDNCPFSVYKSSLNHLYEGCRTAVIEMTTPLISTMTTEGNEEAGSSKLALVLGIIFGILTLCVIIAAIFAVKYRRRRKKRKGNYIEDPEEKKEMLKLNDERALSRTKRAFQTGKFVVLTGIQGAGKTFLAERLREDWIRHSIDVKWICELQYFPEVSEKMGFCILDDLFHELQTETEVIEIREKVDELYERVALNGEKKILLTVTSLILDRHPSLFAKQHYQNSIDLDHLCIEDRKEILEYHMELNNIARVTNGNRNEKGSATQMSKENYQRVLTIATPVEVKERGIGIPASIALACKLIKQNEFNYLFSRWIKTPMSWLHSSLCNLMNDGNKTQSCIALVLVAFKTEELSPEKINSDLFQKLLELKKCEVKRDCLNETLNELKSTYLDEKDGLFTFKVPVVRKVLLKIIFEKYPELIEFCDEEILTRCMCHSLPANISGTYRKAFYIR